MSKIIRVTIVSLLLGSVAASGNWETNYDNAIAKASSEGKYLLIDFTGSDWCPPCIKLKKDIFDKNTFKIYAKEKLVLVEIDFPRKKKLDKILSEQNNQLMQIFAIRGYPTIIILKPDGTEITRHVGYKSGGVENYIKYIEGNIASKNSSDS